MSPELRTKLDRCYGTRRALYFIGVAITFVYTTWSLVAMSRNSAAGESIVLPLLLTGLGAVGMSYALRAFWPLRTLRNAPVTQLYRERADEVAFVRAETKGTTSKGQAIRQIVILLKDGERFAVTLGADLPGFEQDLVRLLVAEAPNAKLGPDDAVAKETKAKRASSR